MTGSGNVFIKGKQGIYLPLKPGEPLSGSVAYTQLISFAEARREYLTEVIKKCGDRLKNAPQGQLRLSTQRGKPTHYWRKDENDKQGIYIPRSSMDLARRLAQKTADEHTRRVAEKELAHINRFISKYPRRAESVYEALSEDRKKLVLPLEEPFEEFVKRWLAQEFVPHPVPPEDDGLVTDRGDTVRSRAELIIINMAIQMGIPNHYEKPLYLEGEGTVYPDMTGLSIDRVEKYVEYFGGMNDPEYAARAVHKINSYERNGIYLGERLIAIFEAEGEPLNTRHVKDLLQKHFL